MNGRVWRHLCYLIAADGNLRQWRRPATVTLTAKSMTSPPWVKRCKARIPRGGQWRRGCGGHQRERGVRIVVEKRRGTDFRFHYLTWKRYNLQLRGNCNSSESIGIDLHLTCWLKIGHWSAAYNLDECGLIEKVRLAIFSLSWTESCAQSNKCSKVQINGRNYS